MDVLSFFRKTSPDDEEEVAKLKCPEHSPVANVLGASLTGKPLCLSQHRPAWAVQAYMRFCKCPYLLNNSKFPSIEPTGLLPQLVDGHFLLPNDKIIQYLQETYPDQLDLNSNLTSSERSDAECYTSLVQEKLRPLLAFSQFMDGKNYNSIVRRTMLKSMHFPLGLYFSRESRLAVESELAARKMGVQTIKEVTDEAKRIYGVIDGKLGQKPFVFGSVPTTFDAILFGHLADAMADFNFVTFLPQFTNLNRFFQEICEKYFSDSATLDIEFLVPGVQGSVDISSKELGLEMLKRADYVNRINQYNQLSNSLLCSKAGFVPDMASHFSENRIMHTADTVNFFKSFRTHFKNSVKGIVRAVSFDFSDPDVKKQFWNNSIYCLTALFLLTYTRDFYPDLSSFHDADEDIDTADDLD